MSKKSLKSSVNDYEEMDGRQKEEPDNCSMTSAMVAGEIEQWSRISRQDQIKKQSWQTLERGERLITGFFCSRETKKRTWNQIIPFSLLTQSFTRLFGWTSRLFVSVSWTLLCVECEMCLASDRRWGRTQRKVIGNWGEAWIKKEWRLTCFNRETLFCAFQLNWINQV